MLSLRHAMIASVLLLLPCTASSSSTAVISSKELDCLENRCAQLLAQKEQHIPAFILPYSHSNAMDWNFLGARFTLLCFRVLLEIHKSSRVNTMSMQRLVLAWTDPMVMNKYHLPR